MAVPAELLTHAALQRSLAKHLRDAEFRTFTEIEIKAIAGVRADVVAMKPSYAHKDVRIYEIKASRSDLLRGIESGRWADYYACVHRLFFAIPAGLAKKEEIPAEAGVITYSANGWHVIRPARPHTPRFLNVDFMMALCLRGLEEEQRSRDVRQRLVWEGNRIIDAHGFGREARRRLQRQDERPALEPALQRLRALLETELGPIRNEYDVMDAEQRIRGLLGLVRGVREHQATLHAIAEYLQTLGTDRFGEVARDAKRLLAEVAIKNEEMAGCD